MSIGGNGGILSSFSIESDIGMGADPSGATGGFDAGFAACELWTPGIGAEPSDEVGGVRRAGSCVCSAVFAAGAGADANGDGLSKTPDVVPASALVSLAGSYLLSAALLAAGLLATAALAAACLTDFGTDVLLVLEAAGILYLQNPAHVMSWKNDFESWKCPGISFPSGCMNPV